MPRSRRTVLIVDDHAGFRRRVRAVLQDEGYDVVGEAPTGKPRSGSLSISRRTLSWSMWCCPAWMGSTRANDWSWGRGDRPWC